MMGMPSAVWLDSTASLTGNYSLAATTLASAANHTDPPLVVFIVYNLPNRDCHAKASLGELCCTYSVNTSSHCNFTAPGECKDGLDDYRTKYIDRLVAWLQKFSTVPVVTVIEPDSLPNLATNMDDIKCGSNATQNSYKKGVAYAVESLAKARRKLTGAARVDVYMDAAHGAWLGWDDNRDAITTIIKDLNVTRFIRGFATNVANYNSIGIQCGRGVDCKLGPFSSDPCCEDPCGLLDQWNRANNGAYIAPRRLHTIPSTYPTSPALNHDHRLFLRAQLRDASGGDDAREYRRL